MDRTPAEYRALGAYVRSTDPQTWSTYAADLHTRSTEKVGRAVAAADWESAERYWGWAAEDAAEAAEEAAAEVVASVDYARDARLVSPDGTRHLTVIGTTLPTEADPTTTYAARCECGWQGEAFLTGWSNGGRWRGSHEGALAGAHADADAHAVAVIAAGAVLLAEWTARQDAERARRIAENEAHDAEERARLAREAERSEEADTCPVCGRVWEECDGR